MNRVYVVSIFTLIALFSIQSTQTKLTKEAVSYIEYLQRDIQHLLNERSRIEKRLEDAMQKYYQTLNIVFQTTESKEQITSQNLVTKWITVGVPYDAGDSSEKLESKIRNITLDHLKWGKSTVVPREWGAFDLQIMVTLPSNALPLLRGILETMLTGYYITYIN